MTHAGALVALVLVLAACGGAAETAPPLPPSVTAQTDAARGGTLRVGLVDWLTHEERGKSPDGKAQYALDPQAEFYPTSWELFRCCLLRTLMAFNGRPTQEGGSEPLPDLAAAAPDVSADGLTWTFHIKQALRYAPPYEDTEILAGDFVRAFERMFTPANPSWTEATGLPHIGHYSFYYEIIEGTTAFAEGSAGAISGLEAPDDHTLVIHLTEPTGDLAARLALPATAPIPPGAADEHVNGYGPFLAASGPYTLDGYEPGKSIELVRNPSWDPSTDSIRAGYADRIELSFFEDPDAAFRDVETSALDLVLDANAPDEQVRRYRANSELAELAAVFPLDGIHFVGLNVAAPPFDDVYVRKAANLAIDKKALRDALTGPFGAGIATHIAPDFLENNILLGYDPYATPGSRGDLAAAKTELGKSRYDSDGDGVCDDEVCRGVRFLVRGDRFSPLATIVQRNLAGLGIELEPEVLDDDGFFELLQPKERVPIAIGERWIKDFPNGSTYLAPLFSSKSLGNPNSSLVGASEEQLASWGYPAVELPNVDAKIGQCLATAGAAQFQCWAELDQLLMEQAVPWVPYAELNEVRTFSPRVASFSIGQAFTMPALDRIALEPG